MVSRGIAQLQSDIPLERWTVYSEFALANRFGQALPLVMPHVRTDMRIGGGPNSKLAELASSRIAWEDAARDPDTATNVKARAERLVNSRRVRLG